MKKTTGRKARRSSSTMALTASVLTIPLMSFATRALAQTNSKADSLDAPATTSTASRTHLFMKFTDALLKIKEHFSIVGLDDGHTIYKNGKGQYFYLDPATGDMTFLSSRIYMKWHSDFVIKGQQRLHEIKFDGVKGEGLVSLVGIDANGNTIQQNGNGDRFYLNPETGDMVFVK